MENILVRTASLALNIVSNYICPGDRAIDATAGNGKDTLKLCELVGETGKVYAFDIQKQALENTATLLEQNGMSNATLFLCSHAEIAQRVHEKIRAAVFNLGYLPGGDHTMTTNTVETKKALLACLQLLHTDGILAVVFYPGHPAGAEEKAQLLPWAAALDAGAYHCAHIEMINQSETAPSVLLITKKKEAAVDET